MMGRDRSGISRILIGFSLMLGSIALAQEEDDPAERRVMERFLSVLEKTPRRGTSLDRVYGYHVEHGSLDALVKRYEDRIKADPNDGSAWLLFGLVEAQRGRDASAVTAFREAERLRPDDALAPYYLGQALVLVGQPDTAVEAFERSLTKKPSRTDLLEIYQALGRVHQRARRADKALAVWARLEANFPDDNRVREQVAAALAEEDQPAQALTKYEALARDVKDEYRRVQFALEAAELKVRLGRSPEALADFERLLGKLDPGSWLFKEVRRKIEDVFLRGDDLAGLAKYYEGWIGRTPDDVDAMARLGKTYAQLGRSADSRRWLDKAVTLAPSRRDLRLSLIEQLAQEKKFTEASAQYEAMVKAEPGNFDIVRDWGRLLLRDSSKPEAARKADAAKVWKRLVGDEVKDAVAIAQAADLFRSAEMVDDAIALYKRAIAASPDSSQYREYLGEYYHQLKRPADALATWTAVPAKTAAEKGRLGEVLAGFGYRNEALEPLTEAVKLAPDDFDLRIKLADLLVALDRPVDALKDLERAGKLAEAPEQVEGVLAREIHAYQVSKILADRIATLKAELDAGKEATAERWTRLARYYEADAKANEAALAATRATLADPKSIVAWTTLGRLQEASGNLAGAADANRTLASLDRRNRADYLSSIARLEARLGRTQEALKAGRELLAASPGNIERHQEFAELCMNLGEVDEGLDALRRASRANPSDPKASMTLADALARQFRTEEAIELYWRGFDRTRDLDGKLGVVSRLADQYLQRNQFDRLISRLERELREPERKRELAICLAQAYQSAGDLGTARQQLESLLSVNPRDSALLTQLSNLAEAEGDVSAASRYLKQAIEIAPTPDGTAKLGSLYLRSGELTEAEAIWAKLASADQDAARAYSAIDSLLVAGKYDTVLTLTERLLLKRPDDWDALYREGVALASLDKPLEAARRFQRILDLKANDDDLAAIPKSRKRGVGASAGVQATRNSAFATFPIYQRKLAATQVRIVTRLDTLRVASTTTVWSPFDFGQARMAALGWLYAASLKDKDPEAWVKARQLEAEKPGADTRLLWDLYYLQTVRYEYRECFAVAVRLVRALPNDVSALYAFLSALPARDTIVSATVIRTAASSLAAAVDKTPPLPPDELKLMLDSFEALRKQRSDAISFLASVNIELKRAKREAEADVLYKSSFESANTLESVTAMLTLAADRGDVDGLMSLVEKYDRLSAISTTPVAVVYYNNPVGTAIARAMGIKADAKDLAAVIKLLDEQLVTTARPDQLAKRMKAKNNVTSTTNQNYYMIYTTSKPQNNGYSSLDFPVPNPYFDYNAIYAIKNAYEIFKKADVATDLINHCRAEANKATEDSNKLVRTLATSYLLWWNDDKDEALKEYGRAIELSKNDVELKLSLAELRAQRGEPVEALEAADSVEPLDQKTMQRRETLALRLAVQAGDVDRARKAAERLFGLRLDAETQVQLATQMGQLGMHELAEAVLARARRRSGGNAAALVSLMLQYQKQGKADVAIQIAHQILRQSGSSTASLRTVASINQENARNQAVQVFARSGKLKELIARAEAQLETSPNSQQLLQTLADYYQADNQRDKVKATYLRMAKLRPDDPQLRLQIGQQLMQSGAAEESLEHFEFALKKNPSLFGNQYTTIMRAYQQAGKADDFVKFLDTIDFKTFASNPYVIQNVIQNLFPNRNARESAMVVFRKAWKELPDIRPSLLGVLNDDASWNLPEVYDFARQAVIPAEGKPVLNPWAGMDEVTRWSNDGAITNLATRLLDASARQGKLDALTTEIADALKRSPDWTGGKALLVILKARRGKLDEARTGLAPLTAKGVVIPLYGRMMIAQEIEKFEPLRKAAEEILETALIDNAEELRNNGQAFDYGPVKLLLVLYQKGGRAQDARDYLVKSASNLTNNFSNYDANYAAYMKINQTMAMASMLAQLGFPADSARFYSEIANDSQAIENAKTYFGNDQFTNQLLQGLNQSIDSMDQANLSKATRTLLSPKTKTKPGEPRLDLVLLSHPRDLEKAAVICLFDRSVKALKGRKELLEEVREITGRLVETYPEDLSVLTASAILSSVEDHADAMTGPLERLVRWVDAHPLEPLPPNGRANARQREEAQRQLILWIIAREALKHDPTRSVGEKLASRALEAAARQFDNRWSLAMLRESGQAALDRGDKSGAETAWRSMLKLVLTPSSTPKAEGTAAPKAARAASQVITVERFDQVIQLARLMAREGSPIASIEATREALASGPPVTAIAIPNRSSATVTRVIRPGGEPQVDLIAQKVELALFSLETMWRNAKADPSAVYDVLREAVLPRARPTEIFLYARPLATSTLKNPRSVGILLVRAAVNSGKADDLKAAIESRRKNPLAAEPAKVLLAILEIERKNHPETVKLLDLIREGVEKQGSAALAEQASLAALPAIEVNESATAAAKLLEASIIKLSATDQQEPVGSLMIRLARYDLASGKIAEARKQLQDYANRTQQSGLRVTGDYNVYLSKLRIAQVAAEFARAGLLDDALDQLGQYADAPVSTDYNEGTGIDTALASTMRLVAALPVEERYRRLKEWTLPTANRKSIRWIIRAATEPRNPAPFDSPKPVDDRGIIGSPMLLIATAKELHKLDELAVELKPLAVARIENAEGLLALVDLARGSDRSALPFLKGRIDFVKNAARTSVPRTNRVQSSGHADEILARAAGTSTDPEIATLGEALGESLISLTRAPGSGDVQVAGRVGRELALFRARKAGNLSPTTLENAGLSLWTSYQATAYSVGMTGLDRPLWTELGGVVGHIAGPALSVYAIDNLSFRYPLTGTFEFSIDAYAESASEGSLGYGGLFAEPFGSSAYSSVHGLSLTDAVPRPNVFARRDGFQRMTVRVAPGRVTYLINGHIFYDDAKATTTSPWLVLATASQKSTAFRNPNLTGRPEIPREVALSSGDSLDGWDASGFRESIPNRRSKGKRDLYGRVQNESPKLDDFDWHAIDGEIRGRKLEPLASESPNVNNLNLTRSIDFAEPGATIQSRLSYLRPLEDGESIAYEFYHEPGQVMIHPAVGHLAFLIEPDGVKLHAIVAGTTGTPGEVGPSNVLDDPAGRRGPVELKPKAWNSAKIQLKGGKVAIEINGKLVYERDLDPADDRVFSFYHDKATTSARARNVVLRGDWPNALTLDQIANLFKRSDAEGDRAARRARAGLIGEPILSLSAGDIARASRKLPPDQAYAKLLAWVLPGDDHGSIRLSGEFGPTDPPLVEASDSKESRLMNPPALDCPALELVALADRTARLDELVKAIESAEATQPTDRRSKIALLALVRSQQRKTAEAEAALKELRELTKTTQNQPVADWQRWPELLIGIAADSRADLRAGATPVLDEAVEAIDRDKYRGPLELSIRHARALNRLRVDGKEATKPDGWVVATLGNAESRGQGQPWPIWDRQGSTWTHFPGHSTDRLVLASPLLGDFEVTCDLSTTGGRTLRLSYGDVSIGLNSDGKSFQVHRLGRTTESKVAIDPPLKEMGEWCSIRLVLHDGRMTTFAQGRKIDDRTVETGGEPWLAFEADGAVTASFRNLKVVGKPTSSDAISLSDASSLVGWVGDYYGEATEGEDAIWSKQGSEIVARKLRSEPSSGLGDTPSNGRLAKPAETIAGSKHESVLRLARPIAEDGEVVYEFFYEPGKTIVHPSLDRLAFLLDPDGVKVHRITDGKHDRTGLDPGNLVDEPASRRGPAKLPLKVGDWNRLALVIQGNEVTLTLNGEVIFVRPLEPTNQRDFGFLSDLDETEARVKNVVFRGNWPKTLPPVLLK